MTETTKKITGVYVNPETREIAKTTIEKSLEGYYKLLNCDCIDIARRSIGGKMFDIICDDEALLKADPVPAAADPQGRVQLFNRLFVVAFDGMEDIRSLTDDEINHVLRHCIRRVPYQGELIAILYPVEY